jgi:hypothetical protein
MTVRSRDVEAAIAMPYLERPKIDNGKLSCLPPGLASSKRHALTPSVLVLASRETTLTKYILKNIIIYDT